MGRAAVFLDRDGVLNVAVHGDWIRTPDQFAWLPGAADAVRRLNDAGWPVVLITNQSGIGRGLFTRQDVDAVHARMEAGLREGGAHLDAIYVCPHAPGDGCECRKPRPGLLRQAAQDLGLDLPRSFFIGDAESDAMAGHAAGCQSLAVTSGLTTPDEMANWHTKPEHVFTDLAEAANWVISQNGGSSWT